MLIKRLVVKELNFYRLNKIKAGLRLPIIMKILYFYHQ